MTFVVHRTVGVEGVDATHHCKSRQKVGGGDDDIHDVVLLDEGEGVQELEVLVDAPVRSQWSECKVRWWW
jgi:hypothetical protein